MRTLGTVVLALAVIAVVASPAVAQRPQPGGGFGDQRAFYLTQESVQKELSITKELADKVNTDIRAIPRDTPREERTTKTNKIITDALKPDQLKRLNQIALQQRIKNGGLSSALRDAQVVKDLGVDEAKLKPITDESGEKMRALFQDQNLSREERTKKMEEIRKATDEKINKLLTDAQKTKLKDMQGKEFTGEIRRPGPPGGGGAIP